MFFLLKLFHRCFVVIVSEKKTGKQPLFSVILAAVLNFRMFNERVVTSQLKFGHLPP